MSGVDPNRVIRLLAMKLANKEIELAFEQAKQEQQAEAVAQAAQNDTVNGGLQSTAGPAPDGT